MRLPTTAEFRKRYPNARRTARGLVMEDHEPEGEPLFAPGTKAHLTYPILLQSETGSYVIRAGTLVEVLYPCDYPESAAWHYRTKVMDNRVARVDMTLTADELCRDPRAAQPQAPPREKACTVLPRVPQRLNARERRAYREAGKSVMAQALRRPWSGVSLSPRKRFHLLHALPPEEPGLQPQTPAAEERCALLFDYAAALLAGRIAEVFAARTTSGVLPDDDPQLVARLCERMDQLAGGALTADPRSRPATEPITEMVQTVLHSRWKGVEAIAHQLLIKEQLSDAAARALHLRHFPEDAEPLDWEKALAMVRADREAAA